MSSPSSSQRRRSSSVPSAMALAPRNKRMSSVSKWPALGREDVAAPVTAAAATTTQSTNCWVRKSTAAAATAATAVATAATPSIEPDAAPAGGSETKAMPEVQRRPTPSSISDTDTSSEGEEVSNAPSNNSSGSRTESTSSDDLYLTSTSGATDAQPAPAAGTELDAADLHRGPAALGGALELEPSTDPTSAILPRHSRLALELLLTSPLVMADRFGREAFTIQPWELVVEIKAALAAADVAIKTIRLEGSAAPHVINSTAMPLYNDVDLVFHLGETTDLRGIRELLSPVLSAKLPPPFHQLSLQNGFGLLVTKQLIIDEAGGDAWAMYALEGFGGGPGIDVKFVKRLAREFEFTMDSLQIVLDTYAPLARPPAAVAETEADAASSPPVYYRTSATGMPLSDVVQHLAKRHIVVKSESDVALVRGGGLLKYARFAARGWTVGPGIDERKLQKYSVNRFMADFPLGVVTRYGTLAPQQVLTEFMGCHLRSHHDCPRGAFLSALRQTILVSGVAMHDVLLTILGFSMLRPMQPSGPLLQRPRQQQQPMYHQQQRRRSQHHPASNPGHRRVLAALPRSGRREGNHLDAGKPLHAAAGRHPQKKAQRRSQSVPPPPLRQPPVSELQASSAPSSPRGRKASPPLPTRAATNQRPKSPKSPRSKGKRNKKAAQRPQSGSKKGSHRGSTTQQLSPPSPLPQLEAPRAWSHPETNIAVANVC